MYVWVDCPGADCLRGGVIFPVPYFIYEDDGTLESDQLIDNNNVGRSGSVLSSLLCVRRLTGSSYHIGTLGKSFTHSCL